MSKELNLSVPHMAGGEMDYILEAMNQNSLAPIDCNINAFEREFCEKIGAKYAAGVSTGTAAIHMALLAHGVQPGDIVFCSTLTFAASANPIVYCGATPVFIDCDESMSMSMNALEKACKDYQPKAIVPVDIYGQCVDYDRLREISGGAVIVEDAAEGLGSFYKGKACGTLGDMAAFSFNTNKIITTSGGGMVVSDDKELIDKIKFWSRQSKDPDFHYLHSELGYNYRMNNVGAGIGRAQLKSLDSRVEKKRLIHSWYEKHFAGQPFVKVFGENSYGRASFWFSTMLLAEDCPADTQTVAKALAADHIEARPIWKPLHTQPFYKGSACYFHGDDCMSERISNCGLCLPSDISLEEEDVLRVVAIVNEMINNA